MNRESMNERFTPGFVKEKRALNIQEAAIDTASKKGISPDMLEALGSAQKDVDLTKPNNKALWVGVGIVAASATAYIAGSSVPEDLAVDPYLIEVINSQLELLPKIPSEKVKDVEQHVAKLVGSAALVYVVYRAIAARVESSVQNLGRKIRLKDKTDDLKILAERGEAQTDINPGHLVIDLGENGDPIGSRIGERLGWNKKAVPIIEGEKNVSGAKLWVKASNPSEVFSKDDFFASLESSRFDTSSAFVVCPQNHDQAFLPDPDNPNHYDLSPAEVLERIYLIDEFCREKDIPVKKVVIIGDKSIKSSVGPSFGEKDRITANEFSLQQLVDKANKTRAEEIVIADPTEIALCALKGPIFNPEGLPLKLYGNPGSSENYGRRFIERCEKMSVDVIGSSHDKRDSLMIVHGASDVETIHLARIIDGDLNTSHGTVSVVSDSGRGSEGVHTNLVLSDLVADEVFKILGISEVNDADQESIKPVV